MHDPPASSELLEDLPCEGPAAAAAGVLVVAWTPVSAGVCSAQCMKCSAFHLQDLIFPFQLQPATAASY